MSDVARVTEMSARSSESMEGVVKFGIERATHTLHGVRTGWVKEQQVTVDDEGHIAEYQVNLMVTFVLD